ncbi:tetratricopeptide repeat-containing serine protease family protein [Chamaesiphon sp. OTE_8_metabat_110]|uniref:tetratricopeptide repeat-containing serine protease family protein n=1 Tax=Chamaesiphon sp. OTE_8_metabat_110 TaxID=2964696 RepID=UPI00286AF34A|nr:tetratricopeptide repeat-containing serine protease family protein [Chamaesiphon sp. OTE_8_metabat_110]
MSKNVIFWTSSIYIGMTIPIVRSASIAATAPEVAKTAKAVTVQILEPGSQGSGVILQRQGDTYTVLTAAHVVRNKNAAFTIATSDGKKHQLVSNSIRAAAVDLDLAVVKFRTSENYPIAKLGNCNLLTEGMDLYVAGYPAATAAISKSVFVFRTGKVSANSTQVLDKGYSLIYSNDTLPGMSGGAVLNQVGEVVAIHGRGDRERNANGELGQKTGFNLGIPINRFATIAANLGVNLDQKLMPISPDRSPKADDYFALANQKFEKGNYRGALADYDRAIALKPDYAKAYRARSTVKSGKIGDPQGALADLDRAIQIAPNDGLAYAIRGFLKHDSLQDSQGALADLNRSIQLDPNNNNAYAMRGGIKYQKLNDPQGALNDLDRAIQLDPNAANSYLLRGIVRYQAFKNSQGGLADLNRAIQLDPQNANSYVLRGLIYNSIGNRTVAIKNIRQAAKLAKQQGNRQVYQQATDFLKQLGANATESGF